MSVRRLLAEVDSEELAEWMAFAALEGLGPEREDFRAGQICATFANLHRDPKKDPFMPSDFMPHLNGDEEETDVEAESDDGAVLLPDPEAHSRLIMAAVFGITHEE